MLNFLNFLFRSLKRCYVIPNCILEGRNFNKHLFVLNCFCYQKQSILYIYLVFVINLTGSEEIIDVYELRFNISKLLVDGARVSLAELRVYQTPNKRQSHNGVHIEVCESHNNHTQCGGYNALDSEWSLSNEKKWVSLDVTAVVQKWLYDPKTNDHGLTVTVTSTAGVDKDSHFSPIYLGGAKDKNVGNDFEESWPNILVWFVPRERVESTRRRRNRRSLNWRFCKKRPRESRCCLRSLYIDFEKDLRWKWIHAPKGFYANYCAGRCPFLWGSEKQNHHTSIMALYNRINPNAPGDPCCVPKEYEPLVILYFKDGQPKVDELSNMAVSECTCLWTTYCILYFLQSLSIYLLLCLEFPYLSRSDNILFFSKHDFS